MKKLILVLTLFSTQAFAVTADECFQALKTFDQHSKTIQVRVSAGEDQMGIVYIVPASGTSMQDRAASTQLRRICALAGVRRSFNSRPDNVSRPVTACVGTNCDQFEGSLAKVITVTEFLSRGGLK